MKRLNLYAFHIHVKFSDLRVTNRPFVSDLFQYWNKPWNWIARIFKADHFQFRNENYCARSRKSKNCAEAYWSMPHKRFWRLTQRLRNKAISGWKPVNFRLLGYRSTQWSSGHRFYSIWVFPAWFPPCDRRASDFLHWCGWPAHRWGCRLRQYRI